MRAEDLHELLGAAGKCAGLVYSWALDRDPNPSDNQAALCGGLLHAAQAIIAAGEGIPIWVVTSGAQSANRLVSDPHQSTLWGLCKSISQEHPGLTCPRYRSGSRVFRCRRARTTFGMKSALLMRKIRLHITRLKGSSRVSFGQK